MTDPAVEPPLSGERELFLSILKDRLRRRTRWGGVVLFLSPLIPYEQVADTPQFLWQIVDELPLAALVAAFALSIAGLAIFIASHAAKRAGSLGLVTLTALATAFGAIALGAERAAWDVLPLPESLVERPVSMLLGMALAGAGTNLVFKAHTRRVGRALMVMAIASVLIFYAWPSRGEAPILTVVRLGLLIPFLSSFRLMLGYALIHGVLLFPLLVAVFALIFALAPPSREPRILSRLVTFGFPGLLGFFVFRSLLVHFGDASVPSTLGNVVLLAALLGTSSAAFEALGELVAARGIDSSGEPGWPISRVGAIAGAVSTLSLLGVAVLARPPEKGVSWSLAATTPENDKLFGELIPRWSQNRARWDRSLKGGSSALEMVELKAAERAIKEASEPIDPGVRSALTELIGESRDLDLAGRRWHRLLADVNEANRRAGYAYYVDPTLFIVPTKDGPDRRFALRSYKVERVHPVLMSGDPFATLHVRRIAGTAGHDRLLGYSRDVQPFAVVVLDEIDLVEQELGQTARVDPPSCGIEVTMSEAARLCGQALAKIATAGQHGALRSALVSMTERHELQHQFDGPRLPMPRAVLARLGGHAPNARERVNRELSAYVAEMSAGEQAAQMGLVTFYRFSFAEPGSLSHHVAVLGLGALVDRDFKEADRDALDRSFAELFQLDAANLAERVKKAWRRLYGRKLPEIKEM